jgi:hypothetical protein
LRAEKFEAQVGAIGDDRFGFVVAEPHGDCFAVDARAEDRDRLVALQHGVVGNQGIEPHVGAGAAAEQAGGDGERADA